MTRCRNGCYRDAFRTSRRCLLCLEYDRKAEKLGYSGYVKWTDQINRTMYCWLWTGVLTKGNYGLFRNNKGWTVMAHRAGYEHYVGPIPQGYQLDHLCRNPRCVNPKHFEAVPPHTNRERIGKAADIEQIKNNRKENQQQKHEQVNTGKDNQAQA